MQGHRESIILGKNLNTGDTEGVLVVCILSSMIHPLRNFWWRIVWGLRPGIELGGKSMRVRPGVACNHSQFQQFIAGK